MLRTVALIEQTPVPTSRRDHFRMRDDAWATLTTSQNTVITMMQDIADAGLAATGPDGLAGGRLRQMRDFYSYMLPELPALIDRWQRMPPNPPPTRRA